MKKGSKKKNSNWKPFGFLFKNISPRGFAFIFGREAYQTMAFLLSFAPDPGYVHAAIEACQDKEFAEFAYGYLSHAADEAVDIKFIQKIEKHVKEIIGETKESYSQELRKNIAIKEEHENAQH